MNIVIDATIAYKLLVGTDCDTAISDKDDFLAPDLIIGELLNTRWKMGRAGNATPPLTAVFDFLDRLRIEPSRSYAPAAAMLAERLNHPIYDCLYVALAQRENAQLLTNDKHLARKLKANKLGSLLA